MTTPEREAEEETGKALTAEAGSETTTPEASPAATDTPEATGDMLFDALWAKVIEAWDDDKTHGAILEYAVTAERLPDLAGRYRALKDDAARGERAKKRLDAIVLAATQLMMSMRTPPSTSVPLPITLSVAGVCLFVLALVAYSVFHRG